MAAKSHAFDWRAYDEWNQELVARFFSGSYRQQPVYLDLEESTLSEVGSALGLEVPTDAGRVLEETVRDSLHSVTGEEAVFARHVARLRAWREDGRPEPPPFVALLCFLSLVAEKMQSDEHFRAHNFYGRLAQALKESWDEPEIIRKLGSEFRRDTPQIWNALRAWLVRHEGELGLPTAEAFDRREYIGLPMSQALVRAADRKKLPELFAHFHLRPGQSVAVEDLRLLMAQWVASSVMSPAFKHLFARSKHAAHQIATIAAIELESWDGVVERDHATGGRRRHARLVLSARLRLTTRQLNFELAVQGSLGLPSGTYRLQNDDAAPARAAFEDSQLEISVPGSERRNWLTIPESPAVSYADLLLGSARFQHVSEPVTIERNPSQFVALERDEERKSFVEVSNITLGADLLLLVHSSLGEQVLEIAEHCARPGWKLLRPEEARGLPADWWLFHSVQFLVAPGFDQDQLHQLAPLIPVSWSQVAFGGGFSLAGRSRWHVSFPPELRLSTSEAGEITAILSDLADTSLKRGETPLATFEGHGVCQLPSARVKEGDYRVFLFSQQATLATASFGLRSANLPRHVLPEVVGWFGHSAQEDGAAFAVRATNRSSAPAMGPWISGLEVDNANVTEAGEALQLDEGEWPQTIEADLEHLTQLGEVMPLARSGELPSCLITNAHLFVHPPFDDRVPVAERPPRVGICRYCGYRKFFPKRRKVLCAPAESAQQETLVRHEMEQPGDVDAAVTSSSPDENALLDALSFERTGTYQSFSDKATQVSDEPWYPSEAANLLSALGHIDLTRDQRSLRPSQWRIAPTTIHVVLSSNAATIVGFRSSRLLDQLRDDIGALGLTLQVDRCKAAPDRILIKDCDPVAADLLCESVSSNLSIDCRVVEDAHLRIAELCPQLADLLLALPVQEFPRGWKLEQYSVPTNRWEPAREAQPGHSYSAQSSGRRLFGYVTQRDFNERTMTVADYRTVKYLAAAATRYRLLTYDAQTQILAARLGSPLPGLYERAAVSCSGSPPTIDRARTCYRDVPEYVAQHLIGKLCTLKGNSVATT